MTATEPCWVVLVDGRQVDHESHFTHEEALEEVEDRDGGAVAKQLDSPCVTVACSQCRALYDLEADDRVYHFDTLEQALADASGADWTISKGGKVYCPGCQQWGDDRG